MKTKHLLNRHFLNSPKSPSSGSLKLALSSFLLLIILSLTGFRASAQEVSELTGVLSGDDQTAGELRTLYELVPTLYIYAGGPFRTNLEPPAGIDVEAGSMDQLYAANPEYSTVQIIRIRIKTPEDLNLALDVSRLAGFNSLKYVYFLCGLEICEDSPSKSACEIEKITKMILSDGNSTFRFFYLIAKPS